MPPSAEMVLAPEIRSRGWRGTIINERAQLIDLLEDSPSLRNFAASSLTQAYQRRYSGGLPKWLMPEDAAAMPD